jgi:hypothetical protein
MSYGAQGLKGCDDDDDDDDDNDDYGLFFFRQPNIANSKQTEIHVYTVYIFFLNLPHALCGLLGPPSWAWQELNRLLKFGRP